MLRSKVKSLHYMLEALKDISDSLEVIAHNSKELVEELRRFNDWKELENGEYDSLEEFLDAGHQE